MPRVAPEELDLSSVILRLTQMERKHASLERSVALNSDHMTTMMEVQLQASSYSAAVKCDAQQRPTDRRVPSQKSGPRPEKISAGSVTAPQSGQSTVGAGEDAETPPPSTQRVATDNTDNVSDMQTDGFLKPREQRCRASRQNERSDRQPVFGSGE